MEPNLEMKTPPPHAGKVEGLGDSAKLPRLYAPPYRCDGWKTAEWVAWAFPLFKAGEGTATLCITGVGQTSLPGCTYACHGKLQSVAMVQTHRWKQHPTLHLKAESIHQKRHQTYFIQNSGRLNSEKETYLWRTHGIIGISLKRHLS